MKTWKKMLLLFFALGSFLWKTETVDVNAYVSSEWEVSRQSGTGAADVWQINADSLVSNNPHGGLRNFLVSNSPDMAASGDYSVTVNLQGTMGFPNSKETQAGIIPWYVDDNNFVAVYLQWRGPNADDRPNELNQVQVTGKINGENLQIWDGNTSSWQPREWNDWWTDGNTTASNTNIKFKVERVFQNNDAYRYYFYINDQYIGEHGIRGDMAAAQATGKIGLFAYNDTFTFTNITKGAYSGSSSGGGGGSSGGNVSTSGDWELVSPAGKNIWSVDTNNVVKADATENTGWLDTNAFVKNTENKKNFYMASDIEVTSLMTGFNSLTNKDIEEYKVGFVPYFVDYSNFCFIWVGRWAAGSQAQITVTCKVNGSVLGSEEFANSDWLPFDITTPVQMAVQINGDSIEIFTNNNTSIPTYTAYLPGFSDRPMTNSKLGYNVLNVSAEFSNHDFLKDEKPAPTEKPVIEEVTTRVTEALINQTITLPIFTASNSFGDIMDPVTTVTDPSGNAVELNKGRFTPTVAGVYVVKVTCTDSYGNVAEPIEYNIVVTDGSSSSGNTSDSSSAAPSETPSESTTPVDSTTTNSSTPVESTTPVDSAPIDGNQGDNTGGNQGGDNTQQPSDGFISNLGTDPWVSGGATIGITSVLSVGSIVCYIILKKLKGGL